MERDRESVVFPHLTIMSSMSNEGERQRPRHRPGHTGKSGGRMREEGTREAGE